MHFLFERRNIKDDKIDFLCLLDSYSKHFDKNDYIVYIGSYRVSFFNIFGWWCAS